MDPNHRDRIAFLRLCSGRFRRGMKLKHVRTGKTIAVQSPVLFFGQDRQIADEAVAGDVIGVPNHGTLRVGDTLSEDSAIRFTGLPSFAPEVLRRVLHGDASKVKAVRQALEDLAEEGLVQVFRPLSGGHWIVGVVGILQLDVLKSRIAGEYNAEIVLEPVPYETARWIASEAGEAALDTFRSGESRQPCGGSGRPPGLPRPQFLGARQHHEALPGGRIPRHLRAGELIQRLDPAA